MNPSPAKRPRRTSSPPSPDAALQHRTSPSRTLPPIHTGPPSHTPFAGPSGWQSATWRSSSRRSLEGEGSESPRPEGADEGNAGGSAGGSAGPSGSGGMVFTRDVSSRAPRSMMACTRCRRQKMKCDGPNSVPCRGCRQAGQPCIFEPRSRPKSISVIPSRPFYPGRPGSPAAFYPTGPQPAPPITSRPMNQQEYGFRSTREPMPPPPGSSMSSIYSGHPGSSRRTPPPQGISQPPGSSTPFYPPPHPHPHPSQHPIPHPQQQQQQQQIVHPPPFPVPPAPRPPTPSSASADQRLRTLERTLESSLRPLASVPTALANLQHTVNALHASVSPKRTVSVSDATWESYRTRAWPLTPWLVGLRDGGGFSGMVVNYLGKRAVEGDEGRRGSEGLESEARKEVGRLVGDGKEWARDEMRALGVFATWTNDTTLAGLAIAQARAMGLHHPRRTHDDWREWIYLVIMDHLCHIPNYLEPVTRDKLATAWRDRLAESPAPDPAVRDRDSKLLAWLEYAETLGDVHRLISRPPPFLNSPNPEEALEARRNRLLDPWRKLGQRWDAWSNDWGARGDPILSLHHTYAVLYTTSPVFLADEKAWDDLAGSQEGMALVSRSRDAALGVIQAVCSVEIGRTLPYSFALYRPLLALASFHLISLAAALPSLPAVVSSHAHILSALRQAYETISSQPIERELSASGVAAGGAGVLPGGLLGEVVESGRLDVGKRWVGMEISREGWKRVVG
ncbi:hypothetical protein IAT38_001066 [Cryptococcus sp. DSM 104549]